MNISARGALIVYGLVTGMKQLQLSPLIVAGCGRSTPGMTQMCTTTDVGDPVLLDEVSELGFSGQDVSDVLNATGSIAIEAVWVSSMFELTEPVESRTLTFVFIPNGSAQLQDRQADKECQCPQGRALVLEGSLVVAADDGWFAGIGPATVSAQGATPEQIWVRADFDVACSDELEAVADQKVERLEQLDSYDCDPLDVSVRYARSADPDAPWATELGNLDLETCMSRGRMYDFAPAAAGTGTGSEGE